MTEQVNVIEGRFGQRAPDDLPQQLRQLADDVERGVVKGLVAAYTSEGCYSFLFGTSLAEAIVLTTLLQTRNVERMRE